MLMFRFIVDMLDTRYMVYHPTTLLILYPTTTTSPTILTTMIARTYQSVQSLTNTYTT